MTTSAIDFNAALMVKRVAKLPPDIRKYAALMAEGLRAGSDRYKNELPAVTILRAASFIRKTLQRG